MQMAMGGGSTHKPVPAIERLGIPAYQFDTECLHGILSLPTTSFPQSIGASASFRFAVQFDIATSEASLNLCVAI